MQQQQGLHEFDDPPEAANAWVYDVIDGGILIYVGLSIDPDRRLREHKKSGIAGPSATVSRVSLHTDWNDARDAEWKRIQQLMPSKNKMGIKLPDAEAFAIWTDDTLSKKQKLDRMWGWSRSSAGAAFSRFMK